MGTTAGVPLARCMEPVIGVPLKFNIWTKVYYWVTDLRLAHCANLNGLDLDNSFERFARPLFILPNHHGLKHIQRSYESTDTRTPLIGFPIRPSIMIQEGT